ncbi:MAG: hypothetical protein V1872_05630 [bacterium]
MSLIERLRLIKRIWLKIVIVSVAIVLIGYFTLGLTKNDILAIETVQVGQVENKEKNNEPEGFSSEEDLNLKKMVEEFKKYKQKQEQELSLKEEALGQEERRLEKLKVELDRKLNEITKVKNRIEELMKQKEIAGEKNLANLVKLYESVKAKEAANIIEKLEDKLAVEILSRMSQRKAGKIFDKMSPARAAELTMLIRKKKN